MALHRVEREMELNSTFELSYRVEGRTVQQSSTVGHWPEEPRDSPTARAATRHGVLSSTADRSEVEDTNLQMKSVKSWR
ncbi:hypothetical protein J6590_045267 [Homalodisca vitripennis]|nr:hypothetical protein J6590_045267 [Homalodisca vitripennis]